MFLNHGMRNLLFLTVMFAHLFMLDSFGCDEEIDRGCWENHMESQGMWTSSPIDHGVIFNETTHLVVSAQVFTMRYHFGSKSLCLVSYKKCESSFFQNTFDRSSRPNSQVLFTRLHILQI